MRYFLAVLLILAACTPPSRPAPRQSVTLAAPVTQGPVPLTVTFTATASPAADTFRWTVGGVVQGETSEAFTTTFYDAGLYVVSVSVGGVSDSVTVKADARGTPDPGPDPNALSLTGTSGGPAPWAVRYTIDPTVTGVQARCRENAAFANVQ